MTALPVDAADYSKGPSIGNGLILNQQALTLQPNVQQSLGPYYVGSAGALVLATTLGAPISGKTVAWSVLWCDGNGLSDANGFTSSWNQSSVLGSFFVSFPVLGPYAAIVAITSNTSAVVAGVSAWKVGPNVGASQMFGPQPLIQWGATLAANTVQTISLFNMISGPAIITSNISASGGIIRLTDSNGVLANATFLQRSAAVANDFLATELAMPSSDFQVLLGAGGAPACTYNGGIITL
jgi:hypothetical protein